MQQACLFLLVSSMRERKKHFKSLRFGLAEADLQAVADLIKLIFSEAHDT